MKWNILNRTFRNMKIILNKTFSNCHFINCDFRNEKNAKDFGGFINCKGIKK